MRGVILAGTKTKAMAIKLVTTEQEKESKPKYPYFGMHKNGTIVLFSGEKSGTLVFMGEKEEKLGDVG